jgi:hypothetical protein
MNKLELPCHTKQRITHADNEQDIERIQTHPHDPEHINRAQVRMQLTLYWFLTRCALKVGVANACLRLLREDLQDVLFEVFAVLSTTRAQLPGQSRSAFRNMDGHARWSSDCLFKQRPPTTVSLNGNQCCFHTQSWGVCVLSLNFSSKPETPPRDFMTCPQ